MDTHVREKVRTALFGPTLLEVGSARLVRACPANFRTEEDDRAGYADYQQMLDKGVARELARIGLPLNVYTEWYCKIDLHNLLYSLSLRIDPHAQLEIRDFANAMFALI